MSTFSLQIVTPDGEAFHGDAEKIILRTITGDVCILPHHIEYMTALATGMAVVTVDGKDRKAACNGGMLSVMEDKVRVVATTFEWAEDIDVARAEAARERAEKMITDAKDSADLELAKTRLMRALTRINVAK